MKLISRVTDSFGNVIIKEEFPQFNEGVIFVLIDDTELEINIQNLNIGENKVTITNQNHSIRAFWIVDYIPTVH